MDDLIEDTDSVLVKKYIKGDQRSLEILIKRHQQKLYGFIYLKVKDRSATEDLFQDTFIKVIKTLKKGTYNEEGKFLSWVSKIAHNLIIDYFRLNSRISKHCINADFDLFSIIGDNSLNIEDDSLNIEDQFIKDQILKDIKCLINELPHDQKTVLNMRMFKGMCFNEIAESTGVSINTALGRMRYAIINLRKIINKNNVALAS